MEAEGDLDFGMMDTSSPTRHSRNQTSVGTQVIIVLSKTSRIGDQRVRCPRNRVNSTWGRAVVVEFPSFEQAVACYEDEEYQTALPFARKAYERDLAILEGAQGGEQP